jgi:hypothetical protein
LAQLEIDAIHYEIDLLKAEKVAAKQDFTATWEDIQRRIKENRERADTGQFRNPLAALTQRLDEYFDLADIGDLAFGLNIDLEKISSVNANKMDIIIDIIIFFQKRDRLDILVNAADGARPDIEQPFSEFVGVL